MSANDQQRWDAKYASRDLPAMLEPPEWLTGQVGDWPPGKALDLACGIGHASIWLANRGWDVTAVDVSPIGIGLASRFADRMGVRVNFVVADLDAFELGTEIYDLITVFRFLDRGTLPQRIMAALKPGGQLVYETFLADDSPVAEHRPSNPQFLLAAGELPRIYNNLRVIRAEERMDPQNPTAQLLAQKL